jgi:hypothetical protein
MKGADLCADVLTKPFGARKNSRGEQMDSFVKHRREILGHSHYMPQQAGPGRLKLSGACRPSIDAKLILSRHGSSGLNTHHVASFDPGGLPSTTYANLSATPNAYIFRRGGLLWVLESTEVPRTTDTTQTNSGFG